jgi:hypothetical protein
MAASKVNKDRSKKVEKFKQEAKKAHAQQQTPKTHLIPHTEWQSDAALEARGDLAESFERNLVTAYEAIQRVGQAFQEMISLNINAGKVQLKYVWNNGEIPTDKEVEEYKAAMEVMQEARAKKMQEIQANLQKEATASQSGLITTDGQPLTEENLAKSGLIV